MILRNWAKLGAWQDSRFPRYKEPNRVLLDTNAYSVYKRNDASALDVIRVALMIGMPIMVLGELLASFIGGSRIEQYRSALATLLAPTRVSLVGHDAQTTAIYVGITYQLQSKGRPIPTNDIWIAALAIQHDWALFIYDTHFMIVEGLRFGNMAEGLLG
jgi:predicted nucleic acid-binding protein